MNSVLKDTFATSETLSYNGQQVPILGHLVWYSVKETRIKPDELKKLFADLSIPPNFLPRDPSPINAFKRATSEADESIVVKRENGLTDTFMIRFVSSTDKEIVKTIVREVRDSGNKTLSYDEVGKAHFDKDTRVPRWHANPGCEQILNTLQNLYNEYTGYITGRQIRGFLYEIVESLHPTLVRPSGAVYFIPHVHSEMVEKLEKLMQRLEPYGITDFQTIFESMPLIDADKTRALVEARFEQQSTVEVDKALRELSALLTTGAEVTPHTAGQYVQQLDALKKKIRSYEELLQKEMSISNTKASVLEQQVLALLNRVSQTTLVPRKTEPPSIQNPVQVNVQAAPSPVPAPPIVQTLEGIHDKAVSAAQT